MQLVVGAVLVDALSRPTRLLAARRVAPPSLAGQWELPGGKVDPGEAPQDALRRELREELGLEVVLGPEVPGPEHGRWPISTALTMRVWLAEQAGGDEPVAGGAHDEVRWVDAATWRDLPWLPADRPVLQSLFLPGRLGASGARLAE